MYNQYSNCHMPACGCSLDKQLYLYQNLINCHFRTPLINISGPSSIVICEKLVTCKKPYNDHQNLTYFRTAQNLNHCQAHWSLYLSHFNFKLIHHPDCHSAKPDALSRHVDHKQGRRIIRTRPYFPQICFMLVQTQLDLVHNQSQVKVTPSWTE